MVPLQIPSSILINHLINVTRERLWPCFLSCVMTSSCRSSAKSPQSHPSSHSRFIWMWNCFTWLTYEAKRWVEVTRGTAWLKGLWHLPQWDKKKTPSVFATGWGREVSYSNRWIIVVKRPLRGIIVWTLQLKSKEDTCSFSHPGTKVMPWESVGNYEQLAVGRKQGPKTEIKEAACWAVTRLD